MNKVPVVARMKAAAFVLLLFCLASAQFAAAVEFLGAERIRDCELGNYWAQSNNRQPVRSEVPSVAAAPLIPRIHPVSSFGPSSVTLGQRSGPPACFGEGGGFE